MGVAGWTGLGAGTHRHGLQQAAKPAKQVGTLRIWLLLSGPEKGVKEQEHKWERGQSHTGRQGKQASKGQQRLNATGNSSMKTDTTHLNAGTTLNFAM